MISTFEIYLLLFLFGLTMVSLVWFQSRKKQTAESFLVADRQVSSWGGAFSIAVSWVWAPAVFISSLQAYNKGLPGVFWFTVPNVICFFTFAFLAVKFRQLMPKGYTLPDFIHERFSGSKPTHLSFLFIVFGYQLSAIVINAVAGGTLLHIASGINVSAAIIGMMTIALSYSLLSGLKASVFTDIIQMVMILSFAVVLVPWAVSEAGGWSSVTSGFAGVSGEFGSVFNSDIAYAMGIPMTISLIAGPISDQMFYQRALAVKKEAIVPVFVRAGLLFGFVPIILSVLGFVAVAMTKQGSLIVSDPQMVAPLVIGALLPKAALYFFIMMAFAALCSTMDSAFCGISSLGAVDVYRRYFNKKPSDKKLLKIARVYMVGAAVIGAGIALLQPKLLWIFFIYGTLVSSALFPTVFAVFRKDLDGKDAFLAIVLSLIFSFPLSIYANVQGDTDLIVLSSILSVAIGLVVCVLSVLYSKAIKKN